MHSSCFALLAALLTPLAAPAAAPAPTKLLDNVQVIGDARSDKGVISITGPKATLVIGSADADSYRLTAEVLDRKSTRLNSSHRL